ncbi:uncharacterized protein MICPUCDRAFT_49176 [Micromonas pusilla CCMP1545]|uniref:Predicted protein n=2 Tax=Micromonas pusilla TaxID=38833 RepID=C1N8P7_MICPC|nr:uncharacterized protein MICPUCDRAFT_49176 [Micromonas pusilla CCMP1545]EEH51217.1 predicted protein [Micromonas pusilla CCMP1545]|eukprot:XP_003064312.1 predicted protein [Micromonas pusilla CCMP1545]
MTAAAAATTTTRRRSTTTISSFLLSLACAVLVVAPSPARAAGIYDPCVAQSAVQIGDTFSIGIAFYPGGAISDWYDSAGKIYHPCDATASAVLQTKLVQTQSFRPKVDHLTFLRGDATEETAVFNTASGTPIIMTMVAYTANGIISDPRIVRVTNSGAIVGGSDLGRVSSLTLVARFDGGNVAHLQWHDIGCSSCKDGDSCINVDAKGDHYACAGSETACSCTGSGCALNLAGTDVLRCQLTTSLGFSGTDKHSVPMKSGAQIERLGQYSIEEAADGAGASAYGR